MSPVNIAETFFAEMYGIDESLVCSDPHASSGRRRVYARAD